MHSANATVDLLDPRCHAARDVRRAFAPNTRQHRVMAVNLHGVPIVLLPGTGSDDDYVYRAFSGPLHEVGAVVAAQPPQPGRLIAGYLDALDNAARQRPIAVGGVSIGAAVAAAWALAHPRNTVAVLAALPP